MSFFSITTPHGEEGQEETAPCGLVSSFGEGTVGSGVKGIATMCYHSDKRMWDVIAPQVCSLSECDLSQRYALPGLSDLVQWSCIF